MYSFGPSEMELGFIPSLLFLGAHTLQVRSVITFVFAVALGISLGVGALAAFHTYLIGRNMTTLEFYSLYMNQNAKKKRGAPPMNAQQQFFDMLSSKGLAHEYDQGSFKRNFQQVFGKDLPWYIAILPMKRSPPPLTNAVVDYEEASSIYQRDSGGSSGAIASMI